MLSCAKQQKFWPAFEFPFHWTLLSNPRPIQPQLNSPIQRRRNDRNRKPLNFQSSNCLTWSVGLSERRRESISQDFTTLITAETISNLARLRRRTFSKKGSLGQLHGCVKTIIIPDCAIVIFFTRFPRFSLCFSRQFLNTTFKKNFPLPPQTA